MQKSKADEFLEFSFAKLSNNETLAYRHLKNPGKPTILFLHGQLMSSSWFYGIFEELKDSYDLIFLDLRGYGHSSYTTPISSIKELADDVFLFVESLKLTNLNLLGYSMGGAVALQFAAAHSDLIKNLILVSTTGITGFPLCVENETRVKSLEEAKKHELFVIFNEKLKENDRSVFEDMFENELEFLKHKPYDNKIKSMYIDEVMLQKNLIETVWASNAFNISDEDNNVEKGTGEVKNVTCNTLLIHGSYDFVNKVEESEKILKSIGAKEKNLESVKAADHYGIVNQPHLYAPIIKKYVS